MMVYISANILVVGALCFVPRSNVFLPSSIMSVAGLLFLVFTLQYLHRLKMEKCECSASFVRDVMYFYLLAVVAIIMLSLAILANAAYIALQLRR